MRAGGTKEDRKASFSPAQLHLASRGRGNDLLAVRGRNQIGSAREARRATTVIVAIAEETTTVIKMTMTADAAKSMTINARKTTTGIRRTNVKLLPRPAAFRKQREEERDFIRLVVFFRNSFPSFHFFRRNLRPGRTPRRGEVL